MSAEKVEWRGFGCESDHGGIKREIWCGKDSGGSVYIVFKTQWPGDPEPTKTELSLTHHAAGMLTTCLFRLLHDFPNAVDDSTKEAPDA